MHSSQLKSFGIETVEVMLEGEIWIKTQTYPVSLVEDFDEYVQLSVCYAGLFFTRTVAVPEYLCGQRVYKDLQKEKWVIRQANHFIGLLEESYNLPTIVLPSEDIRTAITEGEVAYNHTIRPSDSLLFGKPHICLEWWKPGNCDTPVIYPRCNGDVIISEWVEPYLMPKGLSRLVVRCSKNSFQFFKGSYSIVLEKYTNF